jgi:hypothetical protein
MGLPCGVVLVEICRGYNWLDQPGEAVVTGTTGRVPIKRLINRGSGLGRLTGRRIFHIQ